MAEPIIIVWIEEGPLGRRRWSLRGIHGDGSFYGTAELYGEQRCCTISGCLSENDNQTFQSLVARIIENSALGAGPSKTGEWQGFLGTGKYSAPTVILDYRTGDGKALSNATDFRALIEIMRPFVETAIEKGKKDCADAQ